MTTDDLSHYPPRPLPRRVPIVGRHARLEPLAESHVADLYDAAQGEGSDPNLWAWLTYGPFETEDAFRDHIRAQIASDDPLYFAVVETENGRAHGVISFMRMDPANGVIEIGHIWFGGRIQRSPIATEAIYLAARHAFDDLGNRRLEWKCNNDNARSKRAAERFGFTFEGIFRQHSIARGKNRDTAWFSIIDREWPAVRAAFEAWLSPDNFDAAGHQKHSLEELRTG
jgi:RimJ/RimL family protein N-acetyltransferase